MRKAYLEAIRNNITIAITYFSQHRPGAGGFILVNTGQKRISERELQLPQCFQPGNIQLLINAITMQGISEHAGADHLIDYPIGQVLKISVLIDLLFQQLGQPHPCTRTQLSVGCNHPQHGYGVSSGRGRDAPVAARSLFLWVGSTCSSQ